MNAFLQSILEQIFPSFSTHKANKKLKEKINSKESQSNIANIADIDTISIDNFKQKYNETFETKNKFEDKAKTNVIGITIAITVIMGASGLTDSLITKYPYVGFHWILFLILLAAIVYLLVSGIEAIRVLFNENSMSMVNLSDMATDNISAKENYDDCINRNINRNIIRNNIVYSSYICIRNALICMMILFILVSIPLPTIKNKESSVFFSCEYSIAYSSACNIPEGLDIEEINNYVIQDIKSRDSTVDGKVYSFININKKYCVQYKCFGMEIIIDNFFCFDKVISD